MPLSWNEIKSRALAFSKEWEGESSEDAEAKSFWDDFFNVFGISRRRVATPFPTKQSEMNFYLSCTISIRRVCLWGKRKGKRKMKKQANKNPFAWRSASGANPPCNANLCRETAIPLL